jgi:hypothetical protein
MPSSKPAVRAGDLVRGAVQRLLAPGPQLPHLGIGRVIVSVPRDTAHASGEAML